jgi:hypothetical protein
MRRREVVTQISGLAMDHKLRLSALKCWPLPTLARQISGSDLDELRLEKWQ